MIRVPPWLLVVVAVWVIAFGAFRFYLARERRRNQDGDPDRPNFRKKGFYAQSPRRHMFFGGLYLLMGAVLVAMAFGWKPPILGQGCDNADAPTPDETSDTTIEVSPPTP